MTKHALRIALTIGLVPLWLLGVYAGVLLSVPGGMLSVSLFRDSHPQWMQPQGGERVIDIRVSNSDRLHRCSILALTKDGQIYLFTSTAHDETTLRMTNATETLQRNTLPATFLLSNYNPPAIDVRDSLPNIPQVDSKKLAYLPEGKVATNGRCEHSFEIWGETLDAAVVEESGLWVIWQSDDNEPFFPFELLPSMGSIVCCSAVLMTATVVFLHRRIWHKKR